MNYNPYAAPQALPPPPPVAPGAPGDPQPWDVGEVFRDAWAVFKPNWGPLVAGAFVTSLIAGIPQQLPAALELTGTLEPDSIGLRALKTGAMIVALLVSEFFGAGFTKQCLGAVRTGTARFGDVFGAGRQYLPYLGANLLRLLAVMLGFALFFVPGVILALGLWMAGFYVIDQNLSPTAALGASWQAAKGQKGAFFVLALAEIGVMILGVAACCIGFLPASMVALLARTIIFLRVAGLARGTAADVYRNPS